MIRRRSRSRQLAAPKENRSVPIARIDLVNARGLRISKPKLNALLRNMRSTLEEATKTTPTVRAAARTDDPEVECWIAEVTFEYVGDVWNRVEHWQCEDGSSYKKYIPLL
jgi:hypothetical protein